MQYFILRKKTIFIYKFKLQLNRTPLHIACGTGNLKLVKQLVERGANINLKDKVSLLKIW